MRAPALRVGRSVALAALALGAGGAAGGSTKTYPMGLYERVQLIYIGNNVWSLR